MSEFTLSSHPIVHHPQRRARVRSSRLHRAAHHTTWFGVYAVAALAEFMHSFGTSVHPDSVAAQARHYHATARYVAGRSTSAVRTWRAQPWSKAKVAAPIVGSLGWINLVFGESIALIGQGLVERGHHSATASFLTHLGIAALIETGFTYPIAVRNDNRRAAGTHPPTTSSDIIQAAATAFWLGGAMGVDEKKLGRRHMLVPIAAYLVFAVLLATLGNYHNLAATVIGSPAFFIALVALGLVKKVNGLTGYQGRFERLAVRTVQVANRFSRQK
ncbi:MAG TPA: hypothetical protein VLF69_02945 [Candidatus Saccharimonadales bacterium]|nr:hypothetical protein [Candidatus Saccharimonadales bacterium]